MSDSKPCGQSGNSFSCSRNRQFAAFPIGAKSRECRHMSAERLETTLCLEMPELAVNELVWVQEVVELC